MYDLLTSQEKLHEEREKAKNIRGVASSHYSSNDTRNFHSNTDSLASTAAKKTTKEDNQERLSPKNLPSVSSNTTKSSTQAKKTTTTSTTATSATSGSSKITTVAKTASADAGAADFDFDADANPFDFPPDEDPFAEITSGGSKTNQSKTVGDTKSSKPKE